MRRLKAIAWCGTLLLLAACSAARLAYDHLDTLLYWKLAGYVELTPAQRQLYDRELAPVWDWHRHSQLPRYAADLRSLAADVQSGPVSRPRLDFYAARIQGYWLELLEHSLHGIALLAAGLDDVQADDLVAHLRRQHDKEVRKRQKRGEAGNRRHLADEMDDNLRQWIGSPDPQQRQLVEQWAAQVQLQDTAEYDEQVAAIGRFPQALATRGQPGFEQRLRGVLEATASGPHSERRNLTERGRWLDLLAALSATLSPEQRRHLHDRLLDYAVQFDRLAAEKPQAVAAPD